LTEEKILEVTWKEKETEHYIFHYKADSLAEKEIQHIIELQEGCFKEITDKLEFIPEKRIIYWLCDTREEVMHISGFEYETNGVTFFHLENPTIYAVYNEEVKCVGAHEDAHAISFQLAYPYSSAIAEGLAMYFDKEWWKIPNELCTRVYLEDKKYERTESLILSDYESFLEIEDRISYPIMGAFTAFLIDTYGIEKYKSVYEEYEDFSQRFREIYKKELCVLEDEFVESIMSKSYTAEQLENARKELYAE
jgi:hypothetical protein